MQHELNIGISGQAKAQNPRRQHGVISLLTIQFLARCPLAYQAKLQSPRLLSDSQKLIGIIIKIVTYISLQESDPLFFRVDLRQHGVISLLTITSHIHFEQNKLKKQDRCPRDLLILLMKFLFFVCGQCMKHEHRRYPNHLWKSINFTNKTEP